MLRFESWISVFELVITTMLTVSVCSYSCAIHTDKDWGFADSQRFPAWNKKSVSSVCNSKPPCGLTYVFHICFCIQAYGTTNKKSKDKTLKISVAARLINWNVKRRPRHLTLLRLRNKRGKLNFLYCRFQLCNK